MLIWKITNKILFTYHRIFHAFYSYWNRFKLKIFGVNIGKDSCIQNKFHLRISKNSVITIGDHFAMHSADYSNPLCRDTYCSIIVSNGAILTIGDWSGISGGFIWATDSITIGNHVNIGANCIIMDGDIHNTDWRIRHNDRISEEPVPFKHKPIVIEDDVWLGTNSIVLKGVTIGARTIIGAGSVVTKNIPADCIAAGNPCKVIKYLK